MARDKAVYARLRAAFTQHRAELQGKGAAGACQSLDGRAELTIGLPC